MAKGASIVEKRIVDEAIEEIARRGRTVDRAKIGSDRMTVGDPTDKATMGGQGVSKEIPFYLGLLEASARSLREGVDAFVQAPIHEAAEGAARGVGQLPSRGAGGAGERAVEVDVRAVRETEGIGHDAGSISGWDGAQHPYRPGIRTT